MDPLEVKGILFSHETDIIEKQVENLIKKTPLNRILQIFSVTTH